MNLFYQDFSKFVLVVLHMKVQVHSLPFVVVVVGSDDEEVDHSVDLDLEIDPEFGMGVLFVDFEIDLDLQTDPVVDEEPHKKKLL